MITIVYKLRCKWRDALGRVNVQQVGSFNELSLVGNKICHGDEIIAEFKNNKWDFCKNEIKFSAETVDILIETKKSS